MELPSIYSDSCIKQVLENATSAPAAAHSAARL